MEHAIRRIFMFLLGVMLGYCTGFRDAKNNEHMIFMRMIHRVQSFAEQTVGEHERAVEEAAEEAGR
ncbi:MAG: hypothetical protein JSV86_01290 [Gemmatimonadota bacterium]|nr:MAG: hypothetical protein JSV86_01290 [Gemmatimonadota bacterium]